MKANKNLKVVVMGGGSGTFPVITALKSLDVDTTAVIAVSDSGGSTGRLRDEFGFQPVGDLRQSLAAMTEPQAQEWIKKILLYRFEKGNGLEGHNLGNLILTALQDMTGNTSEALEIAQKVFRLDGRVVPVTKQKVDLKVEFDDNSIIIGEHSLDHKPEKLKKIKRVSLVPSASINPDAKQALLEADYIIIGPGDYYASLMATLVAKGTKQVFAKTKARLIYIVNLMTRLTQTHNMTAADHATGIEKALGKRLDTILINQQKIPKAAKAHYAKEQEYPVVDDLQNDKRVIKTSLIKDQVIKKSKVDKTYRSLLRHDAKKLEKVLKSIM